MATFTPVTPASELIRIKPKGEDDEGPKRRTKEEYRREKELEEARKAGTVPAICDIETGRDINPHIPQYIAQAPWYVGAKGPTLNHQRPHSEKLQQFAEIADVDKLFLNKGVIEGRKAARYRKGACENCGSITHKKKDCLERPRKIGAKYSGEDIAPDEHIVPSLDMTYDAKRDRWTGYDPATHKAVADQFQMLEEARRLVRAEQQLTQGVSDELSTQEANESEANAIESDIKVNVDDEDRYAEHADMPGVTVDVDSRTRITVRNLRIREDTAKYLYNLDINSAYYDPKSRSMRDNPFAHTGKGDDEVPFAGENFSRFTGEVDDVNRAQLFAWEAQKRGVDVHTLAEPTKLEQLKDEVKYRKETGMDVQKSLILEKYGGDEHLNALPKELLLSQTENYVEYNRKGKVVKGEQRVTVKSRYDEDVYNNNHTTVWGSYWSHGQWGYKCCHSLVKNSYCIGDAGFEVSAPANIAKKQFLEVKDKSGNDKVKARKHKLNSSESSDESESSSDDDDSSSLSSSTDGEMEQTKLKKEQLKKKKNQKRKQAQIRIRNAKKQKLDDEGSVTAAAKSNEDEDVRKALIKQAREDKEAERLSDDRKRKFNSHYSEIKAPTEAEMEAYRLRRMHADDPLASFAKKH